MNLRYVWASSWGVSSRLMGALIMTHSDDNGLVLPPKLAPIQVVIVPIFKDKKELDEISSVVDSIKSKFEGSNVEIKFDNSDKLRPGAKFANMNWRVYQ